MKQANLAYLFLVGGWKEQRRSGTWHSSKWWKPAGVLSEAALRGRVKQTVNLKH